MDKRVGIIGLGRMGMPICARLAAAGFDVTAFDLRAELEPEATAAGARWAESARAAALEADVLVTVLPGPAEVREALLEPGEALAGLRTGCTWIDMSTCPPDDGHSMVAEARARGLRCLDAPLGGDPSAASAGTLQLFVGGDAVDVDEQRELLEAIAQPAGISHVGDHGAGQTAKLLVNLLWFGQALATAEALLLARKAGLDVDVLRAAIADSAAATQFVRKDLGALLDGDYLPSFGLHRCCEELHAVTAMARESEVPHELASAVESIYLRALDRYGPADGELLGVALLEEEAGLRIRHDGG